MCRPKFLLAALFLLAPRGSFAGLDIRHTYAGQNAGVSSSSGPGHAPSLPRSVEKIVTRTTQVVKPRQQEVIDTTQCQTSTEHVTHVSCRPINFDKVEYFCATSATTTVGCNVQATAITTTLSGKTVQGGCAQEGCAGCVAVDNVDTKPSAALPSCSDCVTISGRVYASQATILPSGLASSKRDVPSKHDFGEIGDALQDLGNGTLVKRTLMTANDFPYDGDHDLFMIQQVIAAHADNNLVPHRPPNTGGRSSAGYASFGDRGLNLALENINGCTSVLVVSRKGAWLSHFWEKPTFLDGALFKEDVLIGMYEGDDSVWFPGLNQHSHDRSLFNTHTFGETQNKVSIFIITPYEDPEYWGIKEAPYRYMGDVLLMKSSLQKTYGVEPEIIAYPFIHEDKPERDRIMGSTAAGKIVVQYDPKQYSIPEPVVDENAQSHTSCHQQWPMVRVYVGAIKEPVFEDTWKAIPGEQVAMPNQNYQQVIVRDENGNKTSYACIEDEGMGSCPFCVMGNSTMGPSSSNGTCGLDPNDEQGEDGDEDFGFCPVCLSGNSTFSGNSTLSGESTDVCMIDPNEDQGQDGELSDASCTFCTTMAGNGTFSSNSTTCTLDTGFDQGEDGYPAPNATTPSVSDCTLTTGGTAWVLGVPVTQGPACACPTGVSANLSTTYGPDNVGTIVCADNTTTAVVGSEKCSITTVPDLQCGSATVPAHPTCACGGSFAPLVTQTDTKAGMLTVGCSRPSTTIPITTIQV